jgi:hypothetical protein
MNAQARVQTWSSNFAFYLSVAGAAMRGLLVSTI